MEDTFIEAVRAQTELVQLALSLSYLRTFLEGARILATCEKLSPSNFKRHSRKVVRLIEISHNTLICAGVKLHQFTWCSPALAPYKAAYFEILKLLQRRRPDIDPELKGRATRLLLPLSTRLVIQRSREPSAIMYDRPLSQSAHRLPTQVANRSTSMNEAATSMPAPDAFPSSMAESRPRSHSTIRQRGRISLHPPERERESRKRRLPSPELDQENSMPSRLARPHMRRRFGIFCTGKNSMQERRDRVSRSAPMR